MPLKKTSKKRHWTGGRKSQGRIKGNSKVLNLRVVPEVRDGIERAAKKTGISLNQEAQERLKLSLERDYQPPHFRALVQLIEMTAKLIESKTGMTWNNDSYTTRMLQGAVDFLIADLGAKGDAAIPAAIAEEAEKQRAEGLNPSVDPREVGAGEAQFILMQLRARHISTKALNQLWNPNLPLEKEREAYPSKFDGLIDDLGL
jgi:hypothetical protein